MFRQTHGGESKRKVQWKLVATLKKMKLKKFTVKYSRALQCEDTIYRLKQCFRPNT